MKTILPAVALAFLLLVSGGSIARSADPLSRVSPSEKNESGPDGLWRHLKKMAATEGAASVAVNGGPSAGVYDLNDNLAEHKRLDPHPNYGASVGVPSAEIQKDSTTWTVVPQIDPGNSQYGLSLNIRFK